MEAPVTPKRTKSVKNSQESLLTPKLSQSGWDAAFIPPPQTKELIQTNGVNGHDVESPKEGSPEAVNFDEYVNLEREAEQKGKEERRKKRQLLRSFTTPKLPRWKISEPIGGRMINVDPVFTVDEKYAARIVF